MCQLVKIRIEKLAYVYFLENKKITKIEYMAIKYNMTSNKNILSQQKRWQLEVGQQSYRNHLNFRIINNIITIQWRNLKNQKYSKNSCDIILNIVWILTRH